MIPFATQRPSPVPFSPLVVKNGSEMLGMLAAEMPRQLSEMVTLTPCIAGFCQ